MLSRWPEVCLRAPVKTHRAAAACLHVAACVPFRTNVNTTTSIGDNGFVITLPAGITLTGQPAAVAGSGTPGGAPSLAENAQHTVMCCTYSAAAWHC